MRLEVGGHHLAAQAFVCRNPDEGHERVYRWLLERNLRAYGTAYAVDRLGDIYLAGRVPLAAVTEDELDRLLGALLASADDSFNTLLELASSPRSAPSGAGVASAGSPPPTSRRSGAGWRRTTARPWRRASISA